MKQCFASFDLTCRIKARKMALVAIASIIAVFGIFAIVKFIKEQANAVTGNGANVTITAGSEIAYGNWQTYIYSVTNSAGDTFTGFCADPKKHTTTGTYKAVVSSDSLANNKIKLALYAYRGDKTGNNAPATALMNLLFQNSGYTNDKYVYIHAIIGYIHSGDTTGLDSQQITFVQEASRKLGTEISDETDVWVMAKDWRLYEIDKQDNDIQNIMWIENNRQYANIAVVKCDTINTNCVASGAANFGNVEFTLVYVGTSRVYDGNRDMFYSAGQVVATATTDASGTVVFTDLPLGNYVVGETGMNNPSLEFNGGEQEVSITSGNTTKSVTFKNQIVRGDVKFMKVDEEGRAMAHIPFRITSETTGESHIVVSNYAGIVNTATSHIPHSENTNGYDSIADISNVTFQGYGTWFGREGTTGAMAPVNNDVGALPYDTYTIQELSCINNQSCQNISSQTKRFTINSNGAVVDLGNWENNCSDYWLETVAVDASDGDKAVSPTSGVRIKDTVSYRVKQEASYTIVANLMDKTTMQPVTYNGEAVSTYIVIPQSNNGQDQAEMYFDFDATDLTGHTLVVLSYLFEDGVSAPLVSHDDWDNLSQSVIVPSISTVASNVEGDTKQIEPAPNQTIMDQVNYCLLPGRTYRIITGLVNMNQEPIQIGGAVVSSEKEITIPAGYRSCDSEIVYLTFDATSLAGQDVMVAQAIVDVATNAQVGTTHFDPGDGSQIVTVLDDEPTPEYSLITTATDGADGNKTIDPDSNQAIVDTIEYCLVAGKEYTISGILMDRGTGNPVAINGHTIENTITITPHNNCGQTTMEFYLDASGLEGHYLVVFEKVYDDNNTLVVSHEKINSNAQAVFVDDPTPVTPDPYLSTVARDKADNDKYIEAAPNQTIKDTIAYCLTAGIQHTIKGSLKDQGTGNPILVNGQPVESEITFTPSNDCGQTTMEFTLDASELAGHNIVVFERAYQGNTLITSHEVLGDTSQTVTVNTPEPTPPELSLSTEATDNADGDQIVEAKKDQTIKDEIQYCLIAGRDYTIKGVLMDQETNEPVMIDGNTIENSINVTPQTDCGSVTMVFYVDASELAGHRVVVFESAYEGNEKVVSHEDIEAESQTISVFSLSTSATDATDGDKNVLGAEGAKVKDTIDYCLNAGDTYTIKGILMDKSTGKTAKVNGETITSEVSITPEHHCGKVEMIFEFDATSLDGKELVVFESVYRGDELIITHSNLNDASQTVGINSLPAPETGLFTGFGSGQDTPRTIIVIGIVAAVSVYGFTKIRHLIRRKTFNFR